MRMRELRVVFSWAAISLLAVASLASAEPYFGLYGGVAFPSQHDVEFGDFQATPGLGIGNVQTDLTVIDEGFETSGVLGGKFGYFLEPLPILGFELDVFNIFGPDIDANRTRNLSTVVGEVKAPVSAALNTGGDIELRTTGVLLNVIGRFPVMRSPEFPNGRLQPYIGAGGGWINAELSMDNPPVGGSRSDTADAIGAQGIAGLKYYLMPNVALFTEYKYLHVFNTTWNVGNGQRVMSDLDFNIATAGVAFHFPHRPPPPPPPPMYGSGWRWSRMSCLRCSHVPSTQ
jgi:opacity protein-like surface antigen